MNTKEKIVNDYLKKYSNPKKLGYLKNKEKMYQDLINKWIVNRPKNPYYPFFDEKGIRTEDPEYYALLDWIIPSVNFNYQFINMESMLDYNKYCLKNEYKLVRSSIIPFVKINGENYWLLGSFHDYKDPNNLILADFGGKCEKIDEKQKNILTLELEDEKIYYFSCQALNCALRELNEESRGVLTEIVNEEIQNSKNIVLFEGTHYKKKEMVTFLFMFLDYEKVKDVPNKFNLVPKKGEKLGGLNFYRQSDILNKKYRTSKNLTDLIIKMKNKIVTI